MTDPHPVRTALVTYTLALLGVATGVGLVLNFTPPPVPAPTIVAIAAPGTCAPPTEHEQLHIVVVRRGDRLAASCLYVGSRGTYQRTPRGMPEPRP